MLPVSWNFVHPLPDMAVWSLAVIRDAALGSASTGVQLILDPSLKQELPVCL